MRAEIEQLALEQLERMGICPKRIGNGAQQALFHGIKRLEIRAGEIVGIVPKRTVKQTVKLRLLRLHVVLHGAAQGILGVCQLVGKLLGGKRDGLRCRRGRGATAI